MFKIGQKVVCVYDMFNPYYFTSIPKLNEIYTVRDNVKGLLLKEINNPPHKDCYGEPTFNAECFRPITESENFATDVIEKLEEQFNEELITI